VTGRSTSTTTTVEVSRSIATPRTIEADRDDRRSDQDRDESRAILACSPARPHSPGTDHEGRPDSRRDRTPGRVAGAAFHPTSGRLALVRPRPDDEVRSHPRAPVGARRTIPIVSCETTPTARRGLMGERYRQATLAADRNGDPGRNDPVYRPGSADHRSDRHPAPPKTTTRGRVGLRPGNWTALATSDGACTFATHSKSARFEPVRAGRSPSKTDSSGLETPDIGRSSPSAHPGGTAPASTTINHIPRY